jgi:hypothetical protein
MSVGASREQSAPTDRLVVGVRYDDEYARSYDRLEEPFNRRAGCRLARLFRNPMRHSAARKYTRLDVYDDR